MDRRGRQPALLCHSHCHSLWIFVGLRVLFGLRKHIALKKVIKSTYVLQKNLYPPCKRPQFRCSKHKERIQLKFITLQFSCSESIQQLNNRSTQINFLLNSLILS